MIECGGTSAADLLDRWSGSADPDDPGEHLPNVEEVATVRTALQTVAARLRAGGVITDDELEALGPFTRADMAGMAGAVMLVIEDSVARNAPFAAWPE